MPRSMELSEAVACLKDAGYPETDISELMRLDPSQQRLKIERFRRQLLEDVHEAARKLERIDYLRYRFLPYLKNENY